MGEKQHGLELTISLRHCYFTNYQPLRVPLIYAVCTLLFPKYWQSEIKLADSISEYNKWNISDIDGNKVILKTNPGQRVCNLSLSSPSANFPANIEHARITFLTHQEGIKMFFFFFTDVPSRRVRISQYEISATFKNVSWSVCSQSRPQSSWYSLWVIFLVKRRLQNSSQKYCQENKTKVWENTLFLILLFWSLENKISLQDFKAI